MSDSEEENYARAVKENREYMDKLRLESAYKNSHLKISGSTQIAEILEHYSKLEGVSDILFTQNKPLCIIRYRKVINVTQRDLDSYDMMAVLDTLTYKGAVLEINGGRPVSAAYSLKRKVKKEDGIYSEVTQRYRVEAGGILTSRDPKGVEVTVRILPVTIPKLSSLGIDRKHPLYAPLVLSKQGLITIVGVTGSGKSTLIAATVKEILENPLISANIKETSHPIEFVYDDVEAIDSRISQSGTPEHVESFVVGTISNMRKFPTHLIVGEVRDIGTAQAVIDGYKSGHNVRTTAHSMSVGTTPSRLLDMLPSKDLARSFLNSYIAGSTLILAQQLIDTSDSFRAKTGKYMYPLQEYLILNEKIKSEILARPPDDIIQTMNWAVEKYGVSFRSELSRLLNEGIIDKRVHSEQMLSIYGYSLDSDTNSTNAVLDSEAVHTQ